MVRYKAVIAYDGTRYSGFQTQGESLTVQLVLEDTLKKLNGGKPVYVHASGRTDAGVHAWGQVIHFDLPQERDAEKFRHAFDTQSPEDIAVRSVEQVADTFHSRYLATEKTYHYRLDIGRPRVPFKRHYAAFYPYTGDLDVERMQRAMEDLIGTHDFTPFCATGSSVEDRVRTIFEARVEENKETQELLFIFRGTGFLYKMVRILVGTLMKIGQNKLPEDAFKLAIDQQSKDYIGPTAHPEGLYLMEVRYDGKPKKAYQEESSN
ncbi:tRNA pseudouridine(38-40) synthase TruA [Vagococcus xieshaowenii]|uniref:tRNA pseudouridine synthase A n=1 Tax=Vagococcus xieshaowenii TaxID=2562451 RepID=A0A4Z0DCH1_9ENTE|nr:tRNA pseudouridine(38-40) synthase TruA [Vagococcus xieshaowenii]QCA29486.1 tRNA pseudouridine(38-40) synthase TruA [Vagococcus xieshaowenii]TFZ42602.1 tRNA pseudouridine(38-40) synthase TruA [Vagococcus xieshaowenii]